MSQITNILAQRYATKEMSAIWSAEGRIILERELWVAVLKAQKDLGLDVNTDAIKAYESVINQVNLKSIQDREIITRHDVKARIEEFTDLAGYEEIHKGMTSRDLTENVEQLQVYRSLELLKVKVLATLNQLSQRAESWKNIVVTARTHNVAAQPSTMGKRIAMFGEELLVAYQALDQLIKNYPVRGLKGAVGTQMDQLSLFDGNSEAVLELEQKIVSHLGINKVLTNVGQVYPRSLDYQVVANLVQLASAPTSLAKTLRLMAGHETASEGFAPGQTGSSAMPHKMNARSCERVCGFHVILKGYLTMATGLAGDQWNEGDVSCSVVRRVMLPDAFFAIDGLLETFLTVLKQMEVYPEVITKENEYYLPFLMTTTILMQAVKAGVGRETAHEVVKELAVATINDLRAGKISHNDLIQRMAQDDRLPFDEAQLQVWVDEGRQKTGAAVSQVEYFVSQIAAELANCPQAAEYSPADIL